MSKTRKVWESKVKLLFVSSIDRILNIPSRGVLVTSDYANNETDKTCITKNYTISLVIWHIRKNGIHGFKDLSYYMDLG